MKAFLRPHRFRHLYPVRFYTTKVISRHFRDTKGVGLRSSGLVEKCLHRFK